MRPSAEQLRLLTRTERINFELADFFAHDRLSPAANAYLSVVLGSLIWSCGGRRMRVRGLERIAHLDRSSRVLIVANHRSYFDFFGIIAACYWHTKLSKRFFCPTRSTFFYDHPLGPALNLSMSMMRMFPPILRHPSRAAFNQFAIDRCAAELRKPGTVVSIHPEGKRNTNEDPHTFLRPKPGAGHIALQVPEANVIPVFTLGMTNDLAHEFRDNWLAPNARPIAVYFGAPIAFDDLREHPNRPLAAKLATERMMERIAALGEEHRRDTSS